jgi:hypothetical protein
VQLTPTLAWALRKVFDTAAELLLEWGREHVGDAARQPMVCSELVYRSFAGARPPAPYALAIAPLHREAPRALLAAAPPPAGPGRAAHPQCLASWALASVAADAHAEALSVAPAPQPLLAAAPAAPTRSLRSKQNEIETLLSAYANEVAQGSHPASTGTPMLASVEQAELPDLRGAVTRFASAWTVASGPAPLQLTAANLGTAGSQHALERFLATAPDFVTPADLSRTESLYTAGEVG